MGIGADVRGSFEVGDRLMGEARCRRVRAGARYCLAVRCRQTIRPPFRGRRFAGENLQRGRHAPTDDGNWRFPWGNILRGDVSDQARTMTGNRNINADAICMIPTLNPERRSCSPTADRL